MKRNRVAAVLAAALVLLAGCSREQISSGISQATEAAGAAASAADGAIDAATSVAGDVADGDFRIKTAYTLKAAEARRGFYAVGRGSGPEGIGARFVFDAAYQGAAHAAITAQVAEWPQDVTTDNPDITVESVALSDNGTTATLSTVETWKVIDETGAELFAETNQPHTVTMKLDMGGFADSWIVTDIT